MTTLQNTPGRGGIDQDLGDLSSFEMPSMDRATLMDSAKNKVWEEAGRGQQAIADAKQIAIEKAGEYAKRAAQYGGRVFGSGKVGMAEVATIAGDIAADAAVQAGAASAIADVRVEAFNSAQSAAAGAEAGADKQKDDPMKGKVDPAAIDPRLASIPERQRERLQLGPDGVIIPTQDTIPERRAANRARMRQGLERPEIDPLGLEQDRPLSHQLTRAEKLAMIRSQDRAKTWNRMAARRMAALSAA